MSVLETEVLTHRFGDLTAVDGVTVSVEDGEVFALLGARRRCEGPVLLESDR